MRLPRWFKRSAALALLACGLCLVTCPVAQAHKLILFASVKGDTVEGTAYFPGGGKLKNTSVHVTGPEEQELGNTWTDDNGKFSFQPRMRCDHTFTAETPTGHRTTYTVRAEELPRNLPGASEVEGPDSSGDIPAGEDTAKKTSSNRERGVGAQEKPEDIRRVVDEVVGRHVDSLRRELREHREEVRFRDILGGIGYIFGIMGLVLYLKNRWARAGMEQ